jgi:phage baseplate assembly protein W
MAIGDQRAALGPRESPAENTSPAIPAPRRAARPAGRDPAPLTALPRDVVTFVGRGIAWPPRVGPDGSIALTADTADLDSSVRMVLLTAPGERVMRPDFGCRIHELVFEPVTPNTLGLMSHSVREALSRWEPRITVEAVEVVADRDDPALVQIRIGYRIRATNDRRNLVHPFYLIPQEGP